MCPGTLIGESGWGCEKGGRGVAANERAEGGLRTAFCLAHNNNAQQT